MADRNRGAAVLDGQRLNASIVVQSLLKTPEEFARILELGGA